MTASRLFGTLVFAGVLAACGGGGGGGGAATGPAATYAFATPKVNSELVFTQTIVDNFNSTINQSVRDRTVAVNPDGSFVVLRDDPADNSITLNGTSYAVHPQFITANGSGQTLSVSDAPATPAPVTCIVAPHGPGPDFPVFVGQTWVLQYAAKCGTGPVVGYGATGSVSGIETVVVPAGTFSALKFQSTISWTDPNGTTRVETITSWHDTATGVLAKRVTNSSYSGTPLANGFPLTTTLVLQSQS